MKKYILWLSVCLAALIGGGCASPSGERTTKIYNESTDGSKLIASGLARAKKENKRVLLQFGANWSQGCHRLHTLLTFAMLLFFFFFFAAITQTAPKDSGPPPELLLPIGAGFLLFIFLITLIFTLPAFIAGYALLKHKPWARIASLVAAVFEAMNVPMGFTRNEMLPAGMELPMSTAA